MRRQRARHAIKHAGPEAVTVAELQQRFEQDEDLYSMWTEAVAVDSPWWGLTNPTLVIDIVEPPRPPIADVFADLLADESLFIDPVPYEIPESTPFLYDFHLGDLRNRAGGAE